MSIDYKFFYWGPYLWRTHVPLDVCEEMLVRFRKSTDEHNDGLASIIDNVKKIEDAENRKWFVDNMHQYFNAYLNTSTDYLTTTTKLPKLELHKLWINFQNKTEFNPEHTHSGDLSFALYLQIPDELKEENKRYIGRSGGPGAILFRYGEMSDWAMSGHEFFPETGQMFVFPAKLAHMVYPFYSDCERISVSGNFGFVYD